MKGTDEFTEFWNDLFREAEVYGEPQHACFFQMYSQIAAENGDCIDLSYTPVRKDGTQGYQVDGYAVDKDRAELYLAICDFRTEEEQQTLNQYPLQRRPQVLRNRNGLIFSALDKHVHEMSMSGGLFLALPEYCDTVLH